MSTIHRLFVSLLADRRGISAVEYGILIGVVGVGLIAVMQTFSTDLGTWFGTMTGTLQAAAPN
jgi:pilus assembly protein Flp/PilA